MSTLEAALRGGTVAIVLLIMFLVGRDLRTSRLSRYSALLFLGTAAFVIDSAPGFWTLDIRLKIPIHILCIATPAAFWIMSAALFDDDFKARWYHALAWFWLAGLAWREMYGWPPAVVAVQEASSLLCVAFGVWHALAGRAGDLVEWRRQLRVEFAVITALLYRFADRIAADLAGHAGQAAVQSLQRHQPDGVHFRLRLDAVIPADQASVGDGTSQSKVRLHPSSPNRGSRHLPPRRRPSCSSNSAS